MLNWMQSIGGRVSFLLGIRVPSIAGTQWGAQVQFDVSRGLRRYYGLGNDSTYDPRLTDPHDPLFRDEEYYAYRLHKPRLFVNLLRRNGPVVAAADFGE